MKTVSEKTNTIAVEFYGFIGFPLEIIVIDDITRPVFITEDLTKQWFDATGKNLIVDDYMEGGEYRQDVAEMDFDNYMESFGDKQALELVKYLIIYHPLKIKI